MDVIQWELSELIEDNPSSIQICTNGTNNRPYLTPIMCRCAVLVRTSRGNIEANKPRLGILLQMLLTCCRQGLSSTANSDPWISPEILELSRNGDNR